MSGTAVGRGAKRKPFLLDFYSTALGKKYVMAVTGIIGIGFVISHMIGNLKVYIGTVEEQGEQVYDIDVYGEYLRELLVPILPPGQLGLPGMFHMLIFGTVAAILGGLDSIKGAVVGGLSLGVGLAMINGYGSALGGSISLTVALVVVVAVLGLRPSGLFGSKRLERV